MDFNEAQKALVVINDSRLPNLWEGLFTTAIRYAHIRAEWSLMDSDQRREADASRTKAHNSFIDSCNILSRNMNKSGESVAWRASLGNDRKVIGDFACYLHCLLSIKVRQNVLYIKPTDNDNRHRHPIYTGRRPSFSRTPIIHLSALISTYQHLSGRP